MCFCLSVVRSKVARGNGENREIHCAYGFAVVCTVQPVNSSFKNQVTVVVLQKFYVRS